MLLRAGMPLGQALGRASELHIHGRVRDALRRVQRDVELGEAMSAAVRREGRHFPASFGSMVALGERSGMLPSALEHLAGLYQDNTQARQKILAELLLPVMVVAIGLLVLYVEVALYSSIWSITDVMFSQL
jgi:type IV pilus assembly protein PilC